MQKADVILAIGTRFPHLSTYFDNRYVSKEARVLQVEIDPQELGRHYPVAVGILGDARAVTRALVDGLAEVVLLEKEARLKVIDELRECRQRRLEEDAHMTHPALEASAGVL